MHHLQQRCVKARGSQKIAHVQNVKSPNQKESLKSKLQLAAASVCHHDNEYPNRNCVEGTGNKSNCYRLDTILEPLAEHSDTDIIWHVWGYTPVAVTGKSRVPAMRRLRNSQPLYRS